MLFTLNTVEINRMEVTWGTNTEQGGVAEGTAAGLKPDPGYGRGEMADSLEEFY